MRGAYLSIALAYGVVAPACGTAPSNSPDTAGIDGAVPGPDGGGADGEADSNDAAPSDAAPTFTDEELAVLATLSPATLPPPGPDVSNEYADNPQAAALGQALFFETRFSGELLDGDDDGDPHTLGMKGQTGKVACAGCHVPGAGFLDNRTLGEQISLAAGWGRRRAPSILDVGQARLIMWDGRHDALYNQPFGPIESPVEMNSSRLFAAEQMYALYRNAYEAIFGLMPALDDTTQYPALTANQTGCHPMTDPSPTCTAPEDGVPGDGAEYDHMGVQQQNDVTRVVVNMGKALGAYERLLTCGQSRFDQWMHGQPDALTGSEQRGAQIFVGRGQCVQCHSGPYMSDQQFHNVGLQAGTVAVAFSDADDPGAINGLAEALADPLNVAGMFSDGNDGRLPTSVGANMNGAFRTPTLRCVSMRPSLMHTGQFSPGGQFSNGGQLDALQQAVVFFARGGDTFGYPGRSEIVPLGLSAQDQQDLVAFLEALQGPGPAPRLMSAPQ